MVEHSASVIVKAPVQQVYELFTHFNDFPKFMSFIKEVTYHDDQRSHWVAQVLRDYEWDAVNVDWIPNRQIGWRSTSGFQNSGKVKFRALGPERTEVGVYIMYSPPSGPLGAIGEHFGVNAYFESVLQRDLNNFARMVEEAPSGALDPMSSGYLFHPDSAASKGQVTSRQKVAMARDPMMSPEALQDREARIKRDTEEKQRLEQERITALQQKQELEKQVREEQQTTLEREMIRRRREEAEREKALREAAQTPLDPRHTYAAWAHGLGDKDGRARIPNYGQLKMTDRRPQKPQAEIQAKPPAE